MSFRSAALTWSKSKLFVDVLHFKLSEIGNRIKTFETPEKIKGTFLEKWAKYWKNLYIDYKDVAIDVAKDCKEHPLRATTYVSILGSSYYCCKRNPDEDCFRADLLQNMEKVMQVGDSIQNPIVIQHVKWLEECYNEGIIRRLNLGIGSIIWIDNYDKACSLYKAICPYLLPRYVTFHERIVDIGFLDTWWILESKMKDYDINNAEFDYNPGHLTLIKSSHT